MESMGQVFQVQLGHTHTHTSSQRSTLGVSRIFTWLRACVRVCVLRSQFDKKKQLKLKTPKSKMKIYKSPLALPALTK